MARHALLIGGTGTLGQALARQLLDRGWRVTLVSRSSRAPALEDAGARWVSADASVPEEAARLADLDPDAVVLACGGFHRVRLGAETQAGWRAAFQQDVEPVLLVGQAVLPGMCARGWGRLITTPIAGSDSLRGASMVTARRAAGASIVTLTRSFAQLGAAHGVTANAVALGYIDTGRAGAPQAPNGIPAGRQGTVQEALSSMLFLLSDDASYVTGSVLQAGGGLTL
jgi:3-oxoacyl-[acyl-carrier protein] reductase